ncbi:MAG: HAD-IIIA family hydrolase [Bacteroidales bacterium]|nr:HAD-IIIA family hydrolase [Lentimicrobiaceae bacterium]MDD5694131.1 HAD-IIIA family hydrolase [Bacteroidales bacterium]
MPNYKTLLSSITTFIFDYDGVLTDGHVLLTESGDALRMANVKDGYALQLAVKNGYHVAIISGGCSDSIRNRFDALQITDVYLGVENKLQVFKEYLTRNSLEAHEVLYMGDDIPDYELMQVAGLPTCPADACEEIKSVSRYISGFRGGQGCVRDVIEQVMKIQGKWMNHLAFSW